MPTVKSSLSSRLMYALVEDLFINKGYRPRFAEVWMSICRNHAAAGMENFASELKDANGHKNFVYLKSVQWSGTAESTGYCLVLSDLKGEYRLNMDTDGRFDISYTDVRQWGRF